MTAAAKPTAAHTPGPHSMGRIAQWRDDAEKLPHIIAERDALRAEVERLREALREIAREDEDIIFPRAHILTARAALASAAKGGA